MCIRDRRLRVRHGRADPDRRGVSLAGREGDPLREAREPGAVSYTHLRAHETVLDLVCRLLLEKKKPQ